MRFIKLYHIVLIYVEKHGEFFLTCVLLPFRLHFALQSTEARLLMQLQRCCGYMAPVSNLVEARIFFHSRRVTSTSSAEWEMHQ